MYTEFGKALRKLRLDHGEVLKHMADNLQISSSYLSSIETGARAIPGNLIERLAALYNLPTKAVKELERAKTACMREATFNLGDASFEKKDAALLFARRFNDMDEQTAAKIRKIIAKSMGKQ
jgi:transcriptional regulator with XRE-family HTH domain